MDVKDIQIFKINVENNEINSISPSEFQADLKRYLKDLFRDVVSESSGRRFRFERDTTEVRMQISRIAGADDFADISLVIATRLLQCETQAQNRMAHMSIKIQQGNTIFAIVEQEGLRKFVICKADHSDFLNEIDFRLAKGLPIKKKAFKAFVCCLYEGNIVDGILVYDTNSVESKYWWREFLELTPIFSDESNTETAFAAIDKGIFAKIKRRHPKDYMALRNSTIHYFKANDTFNLNNYLDTAIGNYQPYDSSLKIETLKNDIRQLPGRQKAPFDEQFTIVRQSIRARFSNNIPLTDQIELQIKEDVPDLASIITAETGADGTKYVKIKSDRGYQYFNYRQAETNDTEN